MSKIRFVVEPSGLTTDLSAFSDPFGTKAPALVQSFPGRRIIWDVAPAPRMAVTTV